MQSNASVNEPDEAEAEEAEEKTAKLAGRFYGYCRYYRWVRMG